MKISLKRVYEEESKNDGLRVLVDRLWPRGLSREKAAVDIWMKDIAPSSNLRKWFNHDHKKWEQFKKKYFDELNANAAAVRALLLKARGKKVTFLYSSKEERFNNAVALKEYIETYVSPAR